MTAKNEVRKTLRVEENNRRAMNGMAILLLVVLASLASCAAIVWGAVSEEYVLMTAGIVVLCVSFFLYPGLKVLKPNEALVLTLFGRYWGTLRGPGFYFVNPFVSAVNPAASSALAQAMEQATTGGKQNDTAAARRSASVSKKISLKTATLTNDKQKINDQLGNPIIIGIVVIWRVVNTAKAVFDVDNYIEYLSTQCDSALRNIVRLYPYDSTDESVETLRGSSGNIAQRLQEEIQQKVDVAGLEIIEARITHLAYAPEIAAAMLQRQQASAIIDARQMIVDGAVGMVEMALEKLDAGNVVQLDEERKAAMISNLLVVLCGNRDAQPVVNSGSLY